MGAHVVPILPQLPPPELETFLTECPKFRGLLRDYAQKKRTGPEWKSISQIIDKLDSQAAAPIKPQQSVTSSTPKDSGVSRDQATRD